MVEEDIPYKAYKSKVEFIPEKELPNLSSKELNSYIFDLKIVIEIIEVDLEWKDENQEWRQRAINTLKSYRLALLYAKREMENRV